MQAVSIYILFATNYSNRVVSKTECLVNLMLEIKSASLVLLIM